MAQLIRFDPPEQTATVTIDLTAFEARILREAMRSHRVKWSRCENTKSLTELAEIIVKSFQ